MRARLDLDKIAKALGGERRGSVTAKGGYFGALNLDADVSARFKVPQKRRSMPRNRVEPGHHWISHVSWSHPMRASSSAEIESAAASASTDS